MPEAVSRATSLARLRSAASRGLLTYHEAFEQAEIVPTVEEWTAVEWRGLARGISVPELLLRVARQREAKAAGTGAP